METHFHEELSDLNRQLARMGELAESRTRDAVRALLEGREELAVTVATGDHEVNELEDEIDEMTLRLLALQHPVASDLRRVRSAITVTTDLERIGDKAVKIAEAAIRLTGLPTLPPMADIGRLSEVACTMLHDAMRSFAELDIARAQSVLERDDEADAIRDTIVRALMTYMTADPSTVERSLTLLQVGGALERVADHATNIAEDIIFLVDGRVVRRAS